MTRIRIYNLVFAARRAKISGLSFLPLHFQKVPKKLCGGFFGVAVSSVAAAPVVAFMRRTIHELHFVLLWSCLVLSGHSPGAAVAGGRRSIRPLQGESRAGATPTGPAQPNDLQNAAGCLLVLQGPNHPFHCQQAARPYHTEVMNEELV